MHPSVIEFLSGKASANIISWVGVSRNVSPELFVPCGLNLGDLNTLKAFMQEESEQSQLWNGTLTKGGYCCLAEIKQTSGICGVGHSKYATAP